MNNKDLNTVRLHVEASQRKKQAMDTFLQTITDIDNTLKTQLERLRALENTK